MTKRKNVSEQNRTQKVVDKLRSEQRNILTKYLEIINASGKWELLSYIRKRSKRHYYGNLPPYPQNRIVDDCEYLIFEIEAEIRALTDSNFKRYWRQERCSNHTDHLESLKNTIFKARVHQGGISYER